MGVLVRQIRPKRTLPFKKRHKTTWIGDNDKQKSLKLDDLKVITTLGTGGFGRVNLVQIGDDCSRSFALKKLRKSHIVATKNEKNVKEELRILSQLNSDFIVEFYQTFKDDHNVYMLMECCLGGDLWTILQKEGSFSNTTTQFYTACAIEALEYLHSRNIVFRDLKPENLVLDAQGYVKLIDFGFAKKLGIDGRTTTLCGTVHYMAPEIIRNESHDIRVDSWTLGIVMFEFLTGDLPFGGENSYAIFKNILAGIDTVDFPENVTTSAISIIKSFCQEDPCKRLAGISAIRQHKYFNDFDWDALVARTHIPPVVPKIKNATDSSNFVDCFSDEDETPSEGMSGDMDWDADF
ncbi:cGMP-dependent protein kinase 1-like [Zophobas morio]|uniref:cGMP-dependent protein kinase 1-like n=1 Tax=Zophobas morio TaxID=2755281 RepID=UPI003082FA6C